MRPDRTLLFYRHNRDGTGNLGIREALRVRDTGCAARLLQLCPTRRSAFRDFVDTPSLIAQRSDRICSHPRPSTGHANAHPVDDLSPEHHEA